ncbi:low-specificity L-threonine aldolase [Pendulispora rubella]|uniref:Low-specificity L-threonine aldolase n=1 Tax=Pendulispora rubella TaxID=2741070 RepID=A0ABZ2LAT0_9BACT
MIDLRSDTVTLPTTSMKDAMFCAELGDDVYGEDPSVNRLERHTAELLGKEAGLFVASGTMGNLCAILTHGVRGSRVIAGNESHVYRAEAGGASVLGGLVLHPIRNTDDGGLDLEELATALESPDDPHVAPAGLLTLENTQNRCGGAVLDAATIARHADLAHERSIPVHVDGARLFNAAVALGVSARSLVESVDSVQVCFSKGLAAPVGSMLVGPADFIHRARRIRKMVGGGMRQAGVLAAACQVALDTMVERLADDHARARRLAEGIAAVAGPEITVVPPRSNIVILKAKHADGRIERLVAGLRQEGILAGSGSAVRLRAVLHHGIGDDQLERAIGAFQRLLRAGSG